MEQPACKNCIRDGGAKKGDIAICVLDEAYKGLKIQFLEDEPAVPKKSWGPKSAQKYRQKLFDFAPKPSIIRARFRVFENPFGWSLDERRVFGDGFDGHKYAVKQRYVFTENWKIFACEGYKVIDRKPIPDNLKWPE